MAGYNFLEGVLVIEVAQLGMDSLGGYLADMGARVIKVEALPEGDPVRYSGEHAIGTPEGVGLLHLRWNRGKQSVALDFRSAEGVDLFRALCMKADVVIDGLKGGSLERRGFGYAALSQMRPALVYCALSGLGNSGAYHSFRSHASAYDAYAGLTDTRTTSPPARGAFKAPSIGMNAPGLYAGIGVVSALFRARSTGEGAMIEVAAMDAAANFVPDAIEAYLNPELCIDRASFHDATERMRDWPRLWNYATADGRHLHLQVLAPRTWATFCKALDRPDLLTLSEDCADDAIYNNTLLCELGTLIATRSLDAWMEFFLAHDISAMPVNAPADLARDATYLNRQSSYRQELPGVGILQLSGTPIRVEGAEFAPAIAPSMGEHTDSVLEGLLGLSRSETARLRGIGIIA